MRLPCGGMSVDASIGTPFEKLSIFYPMWNEEEYIERALTAGRRAPPAPLSSSTRERPTKTAGSGS